MIIWLASYPRSGNSLFANLVKHHLEIPLYSIYYIHKKTNYLDDMYIYLNQADLQTAKQSRELFFVKTHELPADDEPAIYLVRDGRDAIVSYAHYMIDNRINLPFPIPKDPFAWALDSLINSSDQFGGWGVHVDAWTRRAQTVLVRYEDLVEGRKQLDILKTSLLELNVDYLTIVNKDALPDFSKYNKLFPKFYRRGKAGSWIAELPGEYHLKFWERYGGSMRRLGYEGDEEQNTLRVDLRRRKSVFFWKRRRT
jgi:hypothetical protein